MHTRIAQQIRLSSSERERDAALALRYRVFCEEQGVAEELERDGRDGEALHVVALRDGAVIGTCRLVIDGPTAKLGRMAVEPAARRRGLGAAILAAAVEEAGRAGADRIGLHAQTAAVSFYAQAGFATRGAPFEEAGIEHVHMEMALRASRGDAGA